MRLNVPEPLVSGLRDASFYPASMLVYSDAFTTGADADLSAYNTDWDDITTDHLDVIAANDLVRYGVTDAANVARWTGTVGINHTVYADIYTGLDGTVTANYPGILVRLSADGTGYAAVWSCTDNNITIYKRTGALGETFEVLDTGGTVAADTTYTNCYFKVSGTGTVALEAGDDTNGAAAVQVENSSSPHNAGTIGLRIYSDAATAALGPSFDNLEVWDDG